MLITRPHDASTRFAAALERVAGSFKPVISPAFEVVGTDAKVPAFDIAIFTSPAGVSFSPAGENRIAYCVGDATAQAATKAGYKAISSSGSASELCALILEDAPGAKLLHVRGEVSRGDVMKSLVEGGLDCAQAIVYRKKPFSIGAHEAKQIRSAKALLLPVFSAETVSIVGSWPMDLTRVHVVAISPFVAEAAMAFSPASITVSGHADMPSMVACTASMIA